MRAGIELLPPLGEGRDGGRAVIPARGWPPPQPSPKGEGSRTTLSRQREREQCRGAGT